MHACHARRVGGKGDGVLVILRTLANKADAAKSPTIFRFEIKKFSHTQKIFVTEIRSSVFSIAYVNF